ncbi:MAG TPA: circadian clock KaiB family protein [Gammaproteobacteria bacterium]|nr:circadian clock KaiB family protein [Gammaproteobacteria bacterium]
MIDQPLPQPRSGAPPTRPRHDAPYSLKLYVSGATKRSTRAIENLRDVCEHHLAGLYDLEVIDIYQNPEAARKAQIVAVPTLVRTSPAPLRRVVGDLSDRSKLLSSLNLRLQPAPNV